MSEKILVDLDCLLDTRLGTLACLGSDYAVNALLNNYKTREIDSFPGVSRQEFKDAYAKRDVETLKASLATNVFLILQACIKGSFENLAQGGQNNSIEFIVNYFPYKLTEDEVSYIREMILYRTGEAAEVTMIDISNEAMTPKHCKENYALMIRYDYVEWYEMHLDAIQETPIPGVTLIAPALYHNEIPSDEVMRDLKKDNIHPFRAVEFASAVVIGLKLLNVDVFSIDSDIKPKEPKSPGPDSK